MKQVYLEWLDSNMIVGQTEDVAEPIIIRSCGFLVRETKEFITICLELLNVNGYQEYRNQSSIPKSCVLTYKTIGDFDLKERKK